jgi:hypothetical protein
VLSNLFRIEVLLGNLAGKTAMPFVISLENSSKIMHIAAT